MPKDTPLSPDRISKYITTICKVHSDKHIEYYCKTHAVLGCANCFVTDHNHCADVESVAQKSENILGSLWYKDFISKLELIQKKSRDIEACARENKTLSRTCCTDVVSMVRKLKEEAIVVLNEFEQNTVALAEKMMSEDEENMESVVEDCKVLSERVKGISSEFEILQTSKRVCQLYINIRETEGEVKTLYENIGKLEKANFVRTFTFEPNSELTSLLRSPDVIGTLSHQYQQVQTPIPVTTRDPSSITAEQLAEIRVRSSSDSVLCRITGSAVVSNHRLIITDWANNKVKLLDTHTNKLLSELQISSQPWDVTVFNKTQAAVTLPDSKNILIMKVLPSLTREREITVRGVCPRLEIIDLRGNVKRRIENNSVGNKLFTWPGYVCVSRDGQTIYVSDGDRDTVTSLTCDGEVNALYKDEELIGPRKVCTDHHGNVYVCCLWSKNIHMLTADYEKVKVIQTQADGLGSDVYSVSHCQDTNRLFIGMIGDVVKVYKLS